MKKTVTINLGGRPFTIDEDAYKYLNQYLSQLSSRGVAADEVAAIEQRLASFFMQSGALIIDLNGVRAAITEVGAPAAFGRTDASDTANAPRRLYRSRTDRIMAGVCGGIAEYFSIDPLIIRLLYLVLTVLFFFGGGILIYVILWIAIPQRPVSFMEQNGHSKP